MRIATVVGARPQFVKAAVVSRAFQARGIEERLIHTGQHYDYGLSRLFFEELGVPEPDHNLEVGSGSHATQTARMMTGLEPLLTDHRPDLVLVYGDTNSTLAGALVAAKLGIRLAHVEAGLRAFDRTIPEEVNRVVTDRLSNLLFCPTETAVDHLRREGMTEGVHLTGDVMLEATRHFSERAQQMAPLGKLTDHPSGSYCVATVHRAANADDAARLQHIFDGLGRVGRPVILPVHPRTQSRLAGIRIPSNVELRDPVGYLTMLTLVRNAHSVLTDSGGLQKEAIWLGTPCITLRSETEWVETLDGGWNQVVGTDPERIEQACRRRPEGRPPQLGSVPGGPASGLIADILEQPGGGG